MASDEKRSVDMPGKKYPYIGLGTFTIFHKTGDEKAVCEAVKCAIDCGYRHIDCAFNYGNEEAVGEGIHDKIKDGTITREDIFVTTKLWNTHHNPAHVERGIKESLRKLQLDYIDLFLLHWPFAFKDGDEIFPRDKDGRIIFADHDYVDTWKAMEKLVDSGLAKSIGVSNCNHKQINRILEAGRIPPSNTQIEIHPYFLNQKLVNFCRSKGMTVTAYAPLGNPSRTWKAEDDPCIFDEPILQEIAKAKGKTIAQVVLRFHVQRGIVVVPKSITPSRIKENLNIFDFELTNDEISKIASLDRNLRFYVEGIAIDHKDYGFNEEF